MRGRVGAVLAVLVVLTSACSPGRASPSRTTPPPGTTKPTSKPATTTGQPSSSKPTITLTLAQRTALGMSDEQRVGQLFMAGLPSDDSTDATFGAISNYFVGSVIITHNNSARSADDIAGLADAAQRKALKGVKLFVATDQEGGQVQRLTGPGFSPMPSALDQGAMTPVTLRSRAQTWGHELATAGLNLDLAPVVDTVPSPGFAPQNQPVGALQRNFGFDTATVAAHGVAFVQGMADAGITTTLKHFPGLGRAVGNTDYSSGVADSQTVRNDPYLDPFKKAIAAGASFVMMSTAFYPRIDPDHPAAFSPTIVTGMLRGDLGFTGVIISDDVGIAAQVDKFTPAQRAVNFIAAGGDLVLTVEPNQIPEMTSAVLARMKTDAKFRDQVYAAALSVLTIKEKRGLLG